MAAKPEPRHVMAATPEFSKEIFWGGIILPTMEAGPKPTVAHAPALPRPVVQRPSLVVPEIIPLSTVLPVIGVAI